MKKTTYKTPATKKTFVHMQQIMAGSGVIAPDQGIGYGGEDDGTHDPDAKNDFLVIHSVWDD